MKTTTNGMHDDDSNGCVAFLPLRERKKGVSSAWSTSNVYSLPFLTHSQEELHTTSPRTWKYDETLSVGGFVRVNVSGVRKRNVCLIARDESKQKKLKTTQTEASVNIFFFLLELFKQSTEKYLMNGGWGRLIKYSHHTDAFYRRSFHLLLVYLLASIIALRLFVLDLQRFILGKINSSPSRSDFTWKLEMITAIFLSTNESNEMKRNRSYFIVDSSITPSFNDRIKLFTSPPPQKKENKNRK